MKKTNGIKMPVLIPCEDVHNGKIYFFNSLNNRRYFSNEIIYNENINIGKAVRASCSYPLVFSPCEYNNTELIDGGIRENVPWKELSGVILSSDGIPFAESLRTQKDDALNMPPNEERHWKTLVYELIK